MGTKLVFKPGSFYRICERSGFAVRAEHTQKQWNNIIVRNRSFENRQPQDFVRGRRDDQTVPQPRPRQTNVFLGVQTTTATNTAIRATSIVLTSISGFVVGNQIEILMDNGIQFVTTVTAINTVTSTITIALPISFSAASGNIVTDMTSFASV